MNKLQWFTFANVIYIPSIIPLSIMKCTSDSKRLPLSDERTTYRSCVSCWTSSCQCLLALSSALYIPLMCWITFFLSIPCDRETACVMSPAILEMSLDFVSRRWKRLREKESCFKMSNHTEKGRQDSKKFI